ncbi:hypothetical protein BC830DRAFT_965340 [Chytriomyces sp. MP71]|nr:hypothetical protein BC830DRAFT_965340 [Chytriomyces sp. MP71]
MYKNSIHTLLKHLQKTVSVLRTPDFFEWQALHTRALVSMALVVKSLVRQYPHLEQYHHEFACQLMYQVHNLISRPNDFGYSLAQRQFTLETYSKLIYEFGQYPQAAYPILECLLQPHTFNIRNVRDPLPSKLVAVQIDWQKERGLKKSQRLPRTTMNDVIQSMPEEYAPFVHASAAGISLDQIEERPVGILANLNKTVQQIVLDFERALKASLPRKMRRLPQNLSDWNQPRLTAWHLKRFVDHIHQPPYHASKKNGNQGSTYEGQLQVLLGDFDVRITSRNCQKIKSGAGWRHFINAMGLHAKVLEAINTLKFLRPTEGEAKFQEY